MARKRTKKTRQPSRFVSFDLDDRTYQIDPERGKVYRRFVEIETAKAFHILSVWREHRITA